MECFAMRRVILNHVVVVVPTVSYLNQWVENDCRRRIRRRPHCRHDLSHCLGQAVYDIHSPSLCHLSKYAQLAQHRECLCPILDHTLGLDDDAVRELLCTKIRSITTMLSYLLLECMK